MPNNSRSCNQYEKVDNDKNMLSIIVQNCNRDSRCNISFDDDNENVIINCSYFDNKDILDMRGFSHTEKREFIDITKYKYIIINPDAKLKNHDFKSVIGNYDILFRC